MSFDSLQIIQPYGNYFHCVENTLTLTTPKQSIFKKLESRVNGTLTSTKQQKSASPGFWLRIKPSAQEGTQLLIHQTVQRVIWLAYIAVMATRRYWIRACLQRQLPVCRRWPCRSPLVASIERQALALWDSSASTLNKSMLALARNKLIRQAALAQSW